MMGALFIVSGSQSVRNPDRLVPRAQPIADRVTPLLKRMDDRIPTDARSLVRFNGAVQAIGGAMLMTRWHRPAAAALAASMVPTTLVGHQFWKAEDPATARAERIQFGKKLSILGGLLLAAEDHDGRPDLSWRLSHPRTGRPGAAWRLRQFVAGQPGVLPRARQLAVGQPGVTASTSQVASSTRRFVAGAGLGQAVGAGMTRLSRQATGSGSGISRRARQAVVGRPGVAWRTERLIKDLNRSAATTRSKARTAVKATGVGRSLSR